MCDAFTRLDLEQALRELSPSTELDGKDMDQAIRRLESCSYQKVIDALELARDALDQDDPDAATVLAATDCVVRAIQVAEDYAETEGNALDALRDAYNEVAEKSRTEIDPEDMIQELEFRGYQLVKVPRTIAHQAPARGKRTRRSRRAA